MYERSCKQSVRAWWNDFIKGDQFVVLIRAVQRLKTYLKLSDKISFFPKTWKRVKDKFFQKNSTLTLLQLKNNLK